MNILIALIGTALGLYSLSWVVLAGRTIERSASKHRRCLNRINALEHELFPHLFPEDDPECYGIRPGAKWQVTHHQAVTILGNPYTGIPVRKGPG